jgi:hypothetical protein
VDAQERREVGEWDIDVIDDEESIGAKAHVFLKYLEENENVEIMTPEIKLRIRELNIELDNINRLIDQVTDEERIDELNERKIATEELIEEYSNYIDVYNMIPEGRNGSMALFSVVGTDGVADNEVYAVGTADEAIDEAKRYVSDLLSDAGIEGFNSSFVENYIDFDAWEGYVKEYYEEDVYSNPEVYLNESQRELSFQQEKKINELEAEWESLNEKESETEDEDEIQEISDRIDEIKDEITEIQENPEGDFDEDDIEGVLDELVSEYSNDPKNFYDNMFGDNDYTRFLTRNNLIDLEGLIEGVVETDGVGHSLNSYDGTDYDVSFMDTDYKVLRYE